MAQGPAEQKVGGAARAEPGRGPSGGGATITKVPAEVPPVASGSSRSYTSPTSPEHSSTEFSRLPRHVPVAWSAAPAVRVPVGASARPHRLRGKLLALALLGVAVFSVDPTLRHRATNWYSSVYHQVVPSYSKVPVDHVGGTHFGDCGPPLLQDNDTVFWYTQPGGDGSQLLTITVAPNFAGTISKIAFTPFTPSAGAAQSGQASPYPEQISLSSSPMGTGTIIDLNNPPAFQQENIKVVRPSELVLRLLTTDPGAAPATCAETGIVLYERAN